MKLVVIIPTFNEDATIQDIVARVPQRIEDVDQIEVIVIDDGSNDATAPRAQTAGASVIRHGENRGVGAAFQSGVEEALRRGADIVVNIDGDGQFRPEDIPQLIRPILDDGAGFATCTRFGDPALIPHMTRIKRWGNAWMTWLVGHLCSTTKFTDVSCGFRAYSRDTLMRLNLYGRYTYTHETFINLAAHRVKMAEVPLKVRGIREHGQSRVAGSIVKYATRTTPIIFRTFRDVRPFSFFGSIAAVVFSVGLVLGGFVFGHWALTGRTHPYQSVIIASAVGLILGVLLFVVALVADMLNRLRKLLEELLYFARREHYDGAPAPRSRIVRSATRSDVTPAPPLRSEEEQTVESNSP